MDHSLLQEVRETRGTEPLVFDLTEWKQAWRMHTHFVYVHIYPYAPIHSLPDRWLGFQSTWVTSESWSVTLVRPRSYCLTGVSPPLSAAHNICPQLKPVLLCLYSPTPISVPAACVVSTFVGKRRPHHTWKHSDCSTWAGALVASPTPLPCTTSLTLQTLMKHHSFSLDSSCRASGLVFLHAPLNDWQATFHWDDVFGGTQSFGQDHWKPGGGSHRVIFYIDSLQCSVHS